MPIQSVQLANTFNEFRETTNQVIDEVNKLGDGTGNILIDTITANTYVGVSTTLPISADTGNDIISLTSETLKFTGSNGIATSIVSTSNTVNFNLQTTGVSSGTYGSASKVPVIVVDDQGRITSASNVNVAGVTNYQYYSSNANFVINTADGGLFSASIGQHLGPTANVTFKDLTVTGNVDLSLDASNVTSGTISTARLASGTANNTTYLRGDQTWAEIVGLSSGSTSIGYLQYNGTTSQAGQLDGGTSVPDGTTRLNYNGYFYATKFYGDGSDLTDLSANNVTSGTISTDRLASGTANTNTFLRGDQTWSIVSIPESQTSGSATVGYLQYNGTTSQAGQLDGGTSVPDGTTRLNYNGYFYATKFYGDGSNVLLINANNVTSGTISTARLASGTANNTTYLRGDQTWAVVNPGALISDTTANSTFYISLAGITSGSWTQAYVSSTKLYFNASTGTLSATNFNSLSDLRLKEEVETIENAVSTVSKINGVQFKWKENNRKSYGVIAQELEKILPELVEGEDVRTVNYSGLIAFLINAVKELDDRIRKLES